MNRIMVWAGYPYEPLGSVLLGCVILGAVCLRSASASAEMPSSERSFAGGRGDQFCNDVVWHDDLDTGWRESRRRNVPMVIFITRDQCRYCQAMKHNTWCDRSVRERLASGFVAIRLTPQDNARVLNRIKVEMFPMTLIGSPQGKIIDHRTGYQPPQAIDRLLGKIRRP